MKLENFFVSSSVLKRFQEGPLASQLEGFCQWLGIRKFSRSKICAHISRLLHFSRHLKQYGLTDHTDLTSQPKSNFL